MADNNFKWNSREHSMEQLFTPNETVVIYR